MIDPRRLRALVCAVLLGAALAASGASAETEGEVSVPVLEWTALMPVDWHPEPPDLSHFFEGPIDPASRQEVEAPVVRDLEGRRVTLEGWLVPLETARAERYHEFLLVPYFGACIHLPPPPSNQVVHLHIQSGVAHDEVFEPQRVTGELRVGRETTDLAVAGYRMASASTERADG